MQGCPFPSLRLSSFDEPQGCDEQTAGQAKVTGRHYCRRVRFLRQIACGAGGLQKTDGWTVRWFCA